MPHPSSRVIRLRGLPFSANEADIRTFFGDFELDDVYLCKRDGGWRQRPSQRACCAARARVQPHCAPQRTTKASMQAHAMCSTQLQQQQPTAAAARSSSPGAELAAALPGSSSSINSSRHTLVLASHSGSCSRRRGSGRRHQPPRPLPRCAQADPPARPMSCWTARRQPRRRWASSTSSTWARATSSCLRLQRPT